MSSASPSVFAPCASPPYVAVVRHTLGVADGSRTDGALASGKIAHVCMVCCGPVVAYRDQLRPSRESDEERSTARG